MNICADNFDTAGDIGFVLVKMEAQNILSWSSWRADYIAVQGSDPNTYKWVRTYGKPVRLLIILVKSLINAGTIAGGLYEGKK